MTIRTYLPQLGRVAALTLPVALAALPSTVFAQEKIKIGISMPSQVERRWAFDAEYMKEEADRLGATVIVQYANLKPNQQATQIENMLSQGVNVLIVAAVDASAASTSVMSAKSQDVPVIGYDLSILNADVALQIARDNSQVGQLQADAALAFSKGKGSFAIVRGDPSNTVAQQIGEAQAKTLGAAKVSVVSDQWSAGWSPATALSQAENLLSRVNDKIDGFVVANDGMAGGVIQALAGRNLNGKVFVSGLDAEPAALARIATGDQTMSVYTDIALEAKSAVDAAVSLAKKETPKSDTTANNGFKDVPVQQIKSVVIDKSNLCDFITKTAPKGWVSVADVFPTNTGACGN